MPPFGEVKDKPKSETKKPWYMSWRSPKPKEQPNDRTYDLKPAKKLQGKVEDIVLRRLVTGETKVGDEARMQRDLGLFERAKAYLQSKLEETSFYKKLSASVDRMFDDITLRSSNNFQPLTPRDQFLLFGDVPSSISLERKSVAEIMDMVYDRVNKLNGQCPPEVKDHLHMLIDEYLTDPSRIKKELHKLKQETEALLYSMDTLMYRQLDEVEHTKMLDAIKSLKEKLPADYSRASAQTKISMLSNWASLNKNNIPSETLAFFEKLFSNKEQMAALMTSDASIKFLVERIKELLLQGIDGKIDETGKKRFKLVLKKLEILFNPNAQTTALVQMIRTDIEKAAGNMELLRMVQGNNEAAELYTAFNNTWLRIMHAIFGEGTLPELNNLHNNTYLLGHLEDIQLKLMEIRTNGAAHRLDMESLLRSAEAIKGMIVQFAIGCATNSKHRAAIQRYFGEDMLEILAFIKGLPEAEQKVGDKEKASQDDFLRTRNAIDFYKDFTTCEGLFSQQQMKILKKFAQEHYPGGMPKMMTALANLATCGFAYGSGAFNDKKEHDLVVFINKLMMVMGRYDIRPVLDRLLAENLKPGERLEESVFGAMAMVKTIHTLMLSRNYLMETKDGKAIYDLLFVEKEVARKDREGTCAEFDIVLRHKQNGSLILVEVKSGRLNGDNFGKRFYHQMFDSDHILDIINDAANYKLQGLDENDGTVDFKKVQSIQWRIDTLEVEDIPTYNDGIPIINAGEIVKIGDLLKRIQKCDNMQIQPKWGPVDIRAKATEILKKIEANRLVQDIPVSIIESEPKNRINN